MRKTVLVMLLTVLSSTASADWAVLYRDAPVDTPNYVNGRNAGFRTEIWISRDFVEALSNSRSSKPHEKNDCKDEIRRQLYLSWHTGRMGFGQVIRLDPLSTGNWSKVTLGTSGRVLWKFVCEML